MTLQPDGVILAAMSDLHYSRTSRGALQQVFSQASAQADILLLCGDFTERGLVEEALVFVQDLKDAVTIPMVAVLGNHDYESGKQHEIIDIFRKTGICLLDGTFCELMGIGFAGVKGFAGGFGREALQPWGENAIKDFVKEAIDESTRLESALARLHTDRNVVLLHYSPIRETVIGEHPEVFAYLGSSRLEDPLNRRNVTAVFHGHAHNGAAEGNTSNGIPVYNVSRDVLNRAFPEKPPFRLVEIQYGGNDK